MIKVYIEDDKQFPVCMELNGNTTRRLTEKAAFELAEKLIIALRKYKNEK